MHEIVMACARCGRARALQGAFCDFCGASMPSAFQLAPPVSLPSTRAVAEVPGPVPHAWVWPVGAALLLVLAATWFLSVRLDPFTDFSGWFDLLVVRLIFVVGAATLVLLDARHLGLQRLKLARLRLTASERTSPWDWFWWVALLWFVGLPWYLGVRAKAWRRAMQAEHAGQFPSAKAMKDSLKAYPHIRGNQVLPL